jgi:Tannase and feruloyl esterase
MDLLHSAARARRRLPVLVCLAALALLASVVPAVAATGNVAATGKQSAAFQAPSGARCSVSYLQSALHLAQVTVDSAALDTSGSFTSPGQPAITGLPDFCDVTLTQTDPAGNPIQIYVWLPDSWNGRFQGVGGAVYECGPIFSETAAAIQGGYASAATDCGVNPADLLTGSWALNSNGTLNAPLIDDFSYAGIHDMTVAGKAVTQVYYPSPLHYSYFSGCSTGGREGLMEAQRYPADYNGIVSGSPAINWTKFIPSELWPELVMLQSNDFLPGCKETAFTDAAIAACADGSGVIENPAACRFNPFKLVGDVTPCGTITRTDAAVVEKIWDGPIVDGKHLWYGLEPGTSLSGLAATTTSNGTTGPVAFPVSVGGFQYWLTQNPSFNWETLTYQQFLRYFDQSVAEFAYPIATDNPNLGAFERDGGKILIWHGLADQLIFPQGTINYYQRVQDTLGAENTATFARLFIAPGAQHCAPAAGPAPANPLQDVVNWVEHDQAPATILATGGVDPSTNEPTQRPLCMYPYLSEYVSGDPGSLNSYACVLPTHAQRQQLTALN